MMQAKALTISEISELCQVATATVLQWIREGKLKAYRSPGKSSCVAANDLMIFFKKYNLPVPENFPIRNSRARLLIVDDDPNMAQAIRRIFVRDKGIDIDVAADGFDAGIKLLVFKPDLVILDMKMPGMNGFEVAQRIKDSPNCHQIKVICVSAFFEDEDKARLLKLGVDCCLDKPFEIAELLEKVRQMLALSNY